MDEIINLAGAVQRHDAPENIWKTLEIGLSKTFGFALFTILVYDAKTGTVSRLYSTRLDVQPVGARKWVTTSPWTQRVLKEGQPYLGSRKEDMKVFSEHAFLATIGCESVLNLPIRSSSSGDIIGSLNLLGAEHHYDQADVGLGFVFAQLVAGAVEAVRDEQFAQPFDDSKMESV